ncbi:MAG: hypothetical protein ACRCZF_00005 [Gemmataceae bacterium]
MTRSDTHYCNGEPILPGDHVRFAAWTGRVLFILGTGLFADGYLPSDWSYFGRGFMIDYDAAGLVFAETANEDLILIARGP